MSELKPCPFCGGDVRAVKKVLGSGFVYACDNKSCGADVMFFAGDNKGKKENDALWNRRAIDRNALLDLAEELEEPWCLEEGFETVEGIMHVAEEYERAVAERIRKAVGA